MFKSFAAVALAGVVSAVDLQTFEFMQYVSKFGKSYTNVEEFNLRLSLFTVRDKIIKEWNADFTNTSRMGHNFLSDWTEAEQAKLRGLAGEPKERTAEEFKFTNQALPSDVNWVTAGNVGPVKDQGRCGSCWAFSATGTVESSVSIATGAAPGNYSEQQLVSCSSAYGNLGCSGGWYYWAWDYLEVPSQAQNYGASYPYTSGAAGVTGDCDTKLASEGHITVASYVQVGTTNDDIKAALVIKPVSVAIDAAKPAFQSYTSGVLTAGCGVRLDHAVIAVGYGTDAVGGAYFLVRNSWGSSWGDNGYVKIGQSPTGDAPGICGINKAVYYPITNAPQ